MGKSAPGEGQVVRPWSAQLGPTEGSEKASRGACGPAAHRTPVEAEMRAFGLLLGRFELFCASQPFRSFVVHREFLRHQ